MNKLVCAAVLIVLAVFFKEGSALLCWECNSKHDPRCGYDQFDSSTLGIVDCSQRERGHLKGKEAKYCRKIVQNIMGQIRTIRGCGWLEEDKERGQCYSRTGTKDIMVTFCTCEGDKCNHSTTIRTSWAVAGLLLIFVRLF